MRGSVVIKEGESGRGCRLVKEGGRDYPAVMPLSYVDAAELLFQMKDFLQSSDTGRRCLTAVSERRRAA